MASVGESKYLSHSARCHNSLRYMQSVVNICGLLCLVGRWNGSLEQLWILVIDICLISVDISLCSLTSAHMLIKLPLKRLMRTEHGVYVWIQRQIIVVHLTRYEIWNCVLYWFESYLYVTKRFVRINEFRSRLTDNFFGVFQIRRKLCIALIQTSKCQKLEYS